MSSASRSLSTRSSRQGRLLDRTMKKGREKPVFPESSRLDGELAALDRKHINRDMRVRSVRCSNRPNIDFWLWQNEDRCADVPDTTKGGVVG